MSVPAAVPNAPTLAVLVLAWNEATPAVRALIEATQAGSPSVDSILVMVPQVDAPAHPSAKEYLPVLPLAPGPHPVAAATATEPELPPPPVAEAALPATKPTGQASVLQNIGKEPVLPAPASPVPPAPLTWAAVRVLRLGSLSLPQLAQRAGQPLPAPTWVGLAATPAAPYLGATAPANQSVLAAKVSEPITYPELLKTLDSLPKPVGSLAPATLLPSDKAGLAKEEVLLYDSIAQGPDPEADLPAMEAEEPAGAEALTSDQAETDPLATAAPRPAVQADWFDALAALRQPASLPEPPAAAPTARAMASLLPAHPALWPAAAHYPAPNLNFQIIQYARFAVPVALAEPPFAVVYAPAWPTWLAAQELRQRTGRPLVLHVSTLAAADDESVDTATGWIAELQRQALRRADLILAETSTLAQRLRHDLGLPASAVQVVPAAAAAAIAQALHGAHLRPAITPVS
ncbi:hypothetical protein GCM10027422_21550 [Hymenobacter arcticus]